jgi:hypothetical protein
MGRWFVEGTEDVVVDLQVVGIAKVANGVEIVGLLGS